MMSCTTALTIAIGELRKAGQSISYRNLEQATARVRGAPVSMRSLRRSPNRELIEAARGPLPGRSASTARPANSVKVGEIARLKLIIADLERRNAFLQAGHRERRRLWSDTDPAA